MVAISAYHASLGGQPVGRHPLVTRFLRGALRLRPPVRSRIPPWDLAVVLDALCRPPFEPIEDISDRHLTLKTVFLLAISSLKRFGDLQALSVAPTHLDISPGMAKAFLYPRAGYVPKVPSVTPQPVVLQAFSPPPFREPDQRKGLTVCVQCKHWTHTSTELPCGEGWTNCWFAMVPLREMGVKAHSTRSVSASKAFLAGVPIQDICNAAGWSTPLTFVRFYGLDMRATPGSSVLSPSSCSWGIHTGHGLGSLAAWISLSPKRLSDAARISEEERLRLRM